MSNNLKGRGDKNAYVSLYACTFNTSATSREVLLYFITITNIVAYLRCPFRNFKTLIKEKTLDLDKVYQA